MLGWMILVSLAALVSAPLAVIVLNGRARALEDRLALIAFWFAFLAFAAVVAGLFARSEFSLRAIHLLEVVAMLGAAILISAALSTLVGWRRKAFHSLSAIGTIAVFAAMRWLGLGWDGAAAIAWTLATLSGLAVATIAGNVEPSRWLATPCLIVAFAFLPVHGAQVAQVVARGELKGAVPIASIGALALLGGLVAALLSRRRNAAYARSGLDAAQAVSLFDAIEGIMLADRLYLRLDLGRDDLAELLGVSPRAIGEAVNRSTGSSFAAYVRQLRMIEFQRLVADRGNHGVALEALGMEAGFKSRSAFYAAVRGAFGTAPGDLRDGVRANRVRA